MADDVLAHRTRIEEQVGGRTLVDCLAGTATTFADDAAHSDRHGTVGEDGPWTPSRSETRELALDVAAALVAAGVVASLRPTHA